MNAIPYGRQEITSEDIEEVVKVLNADYLTQGPRIAEFEKAFASYVQSEFAVAVANGTAALHLCTMALNVKPGDKVITTPITFSASANCIRYCGGEVVLADIDPDTYLLDPLKVKSLLEASPAGTYSGLVVVDFTGRAADLEVFRELADEYGLWIIEDACHAPGGSFIDANGQNQTCGNGKFAELAIFSFHPVKHIACGEGGMITTNSRELYEKLLTLRTHGITKTSQDFINPLDLAGGEQSKEDGYNDYPGWYMEMQSLGYNYRLTDIQAALGSSQLRRAVKGLTRRREIAAKYKKELSSLTQITDRNYEVSDYTTPQNIGHAFHLYVIEATNRLALYNYLKTKKIYAQVHYIPLNYMPYYQDQGFRPGQFPEAEGYYKRCISLPMYPKMKDEEQDFVISCIKEFYNYDSDS